MLHDEARHRPDRSQIHLQEQGRVVSAPSVGLASRDAAVHGFLRPLILAARQTSSGGTIEREVHPAIRPVDLELVNPGHRLPAVGRTPTFRRTKRVSTASSITWVVVPAFPVCCRTRRLRVDQLSSAGFPSRFFTRGEPDVRGVHGPPPDSGCATWRSLALPPSPAVAACASTSKAKLQTTSSGPEQRFSMVGYGFQTSALISKIGRAGAGDRCRPLR